MPRIRGVIDGTSLDCYRDYIKFISRTNGRAVEIVVFLTLVIHAKTFKLAVL